MNKLYKFTYLVLIISLTVHTAFGQTSIIQDISESYLEKLINTSIANYPHIKTMDSRVEIAKDNIKKAKISYFDSFSLSYVYQPNSNINLYPVDGTSTTATNRQSLFSGAQFGVFFNIGSFLQKPVAVHQAKQDLMIANNDQAEYLMALKSNIKKRYYTYLQRVAALKLSSASATDAENMLRDTRYRFEKGEETLDNYNKARVANTQQTDAKIAAEANLFMAKADLEELLGEKLENIK